MTSFDEPLPPYMVHWAADLVTNFSALVTAQTHDEARQKASEMRKKFGGRTRVVSQHVIERAGLGTENWHA